MSQDPRNGLSKVEVARRQIGRSAFVAAAAGLLAGIGLGWLGQPATSLTTLRLTCGVLLALPVVNVVAVLLEEARAGDWAFAAIACLVLALLAFNVARQLGL
jgi:hypothetical protein